MNSPSVVIPSSAIILTIALVTAFNGYDPTIFFPGSSLSAHERFGAACQLCHDPFNGPAEEKCVGCHEMALRYDTHSKKILARPVKAVIPEGMKSLRCLDCHKEHSVSGEHRYSGPVDLCGKCHKPPKLSASHKNYSEQTCRSEACHNYHSSLSREDRLKTDKSRIKKASRVVLVEKKTGGLRLSDVKIKTMKSDPFYRSDKAIAAKYEIGPHYGTEATCARCHTVNGGTELKPPPEVCKKCHEPEVVTFLKGGHGAFEGSYLRAGLAGGVRVTCGACHDPHSLKSDGAGLYACIECHEGKHVDWYLRSGHNRYITDPVFADNPLKGAICSECHMPRIAELDGATLHNESVTVSSNIVMAKIVCEKCHGLRFSLRSLYDEKSLLSSFTYSPTGERTALTLWFERADGKEN